MSTRAVIARETESGFRDVYHHWDGYPSGLGKTLFELAKWKFNGRRDELLKVLIDDRPQGWSTINRDWDQPPTSKDHHNFDTPQGPVYYDDAEEGEEIAPLTQLNASDCGCEWAYVFTDRNTLKVLSSYCDDGRKMIGYFGCGDPDARWRLVVELDLTKMSPNWEHLNDPFIEPA